MVLEIMICFKHIIDLAHIFICSQKILESIRFYLKINSNSKIDFQNTYNVNFFKMITKSNEIQFMR